MNMINYTLIRSRRRTVAIYIKDAAVEVRAPLRMAKRDIDAFVASKEGWINEHIARPLASAERRAAFALNYGDTVTFRGVEYPLKARTGAMVGFDGAQFYLPPDLPTEQIKAAVVQIYRLLARRHFAERVAHFAELMNVAPATVKVNGAKTRWGSCNRRTGRVMLNTGLAGKPRSLLEYVITHELAHLLEPRHNEAFVAILDRHCPGWRDARSELNDLPLAAETWRE
jgi:predicted metal-dependent hydrolase